MGAARGAGTEVPLGGWVAAPAASARAARLARAVERRFAAGAVLYLAGTPARGLYLVLEGRVRVLRAGAGRPHVLHVEGPGGALGEVPVFEGLDGAAPPYPATAVAAEPTRCLVVSRAAVRAAVRAHPELALALLERLAEAVKSDRSHVG
ncbi:cyclic nucleotide-binding domain-containing protein, partial [Roseisolibacter sp. H3M3-2]|uniref:cyclic nucleotide-binding domain-containing protein n=1 Tax=Roseisolibacter sp. H3M3-2 TaxID=3031323 RepID=UPI0023DA6E4C